MQSTSKDILIIAPHPDDETLGMGGMIAQKKKKGALISIVFLTDGEASLKDIDKEEIISNRIKTARVYAGEDIKQRYILIQDQMGYANSDSNTYITAAADELRYVTAWIYTVYAGASGGSDESFICQNKLIESKYWYNSRTNQMARAFNHYLSNNGIGYDDQPVGRFTFSW